MKKISIVGFGRFGKTLYSLIKDDFEVKLLDSNPNVFKDLSDKEKRLVASNLKEVYESEVIFFAVPISHFEEVINKHKKYFTKNHLLVDVLSVKMHPQSVFERYLKSVGTQAILTHPMFGPDSSKNGFDGLPMIIDKFKSNQKSYDFWKKYFTSKKLRVIEMTAKEHDKIAANSQGLTHFAGRLLADFGLKQSTIDSLGTKKLLEVIEQTTNDTWQLFSDLQHFNSFTTAMRLKLGNSYDKVYGKLLPNQVKKGILTIGIQGGKGSFNEEAVNKYLHDVNIQQYEIKYLYTTKKVLEELHKGKIDRGQFAIHNSIGGIVRESIDAMANYKFKIHKEFAIKISHALMVQPEVSIKNIDTIMTHPQVLAQCKSTLGKRYPTLKQTSGKGQLIDHALVAKRLSEKKLAKNIAVMGSKVLAEIYGLKIIEENLQDAKHNYTSFLIVSRQ